jgi:hypothetical protein
MRKLGPCKTLHSFSGDQDKVFEVNCTIEVFVFEVLPDVVRFAISRRELYIWSRVCDVTLKSYFRVVLRVLAETWPSSLFVIFVECPHTNAKILPQLCHSFLPTFNSLFATRNFIGSCIVRDGRQNRKIN